MSDNTTSVKFKLNTFAIDGQLKNIIRRRVKKCNMILIEGIFLFNLYILHLCKFDFDISINSNTIRRCVRLLLRDSSSSRKGKNGDIPNQEEEDTLISIIFNQFNNLLFENRLDIFVDNEDATMKPIEYTCDVYFTNLIQHIETNFKRYQKKYLIAKLYYLLDGKLSQAEIRAIIYKIQQHINGNVEYNYISEHKLDRFTKIVNKTNEIRQIIDGFISSEKYTLKSKIQYDISHEKTIKLTSKQNILEYLKYFHLILEELNTLGIGGFNIVPQFRPKIRHITFDQRILCPIYNEWKNVNIGTNMFKQNYNKYFDMMFNIRHMNKYRHLLSTHPYITTFSTNGYEVSVHLEKIKTNRKKQKGFTKRKKKEQHLKIDFETEYKNWIKKQIGIKSLTFNVGDLKSTDDFILDTFDLGGADIGNQVVIDIEMQNGMHKTINKNYLNDIAHVTINRKKLDDFKSENSEMRVIDKKLSNCNTKTTDDQTYIKYMQEIRDNWDAIWEYHTKDKIFAINFDSYVNKDKAISRVAREIIRDIKDKSTVPKRYIKYFDDEMFEKTKDRPILLAVGNGNGTGTISNTKGTSPKGSIKKLINELSKYCIIIQTPEPNTSKYCSECMKSDHKSELQGVEVYKYPAKKNFKRENDNHERRFKETFTNFYSRCNGNVLCPPIEQRIKMTESAKHNTHVLKRKLHELKRANHKNKMTRELVQITKNEIDRLDGLVNEFECYDNESYRLRRCAARHLHSNNRCILLERNVNAAINMIKIMLTIITTGKLGNFAIKKNNSRNKKSNKNRKKRVSKKIKNVVRKTKKDA